MITRLKGDQASHGWKPKPAGSRKLSGKTSGCFTGDQTGERAKTPKSRATREEAKGPYIHDASQGLQSRAAEAGCTSPSNRGPAEYQTGSQAAPFFCFFWKKLQFPLLQASKPVHPSTGSGRTEKPCKHLCVRGELVEPLKILFHNLLDIPPLNAAQELS